MPSSIQGAFLSSLTSLYAQQAQINAISQNVANSSTPGYSSEGVPVTTIADGGGVATGAVQRVSNGTLAAASNQAASAQAYSQQMTDVLASYSQVLSQTGSTSSDDATQTTSNVLSSAMTALQTSLTSLSASPGDATTQASAVSSAQDLVDTFHTLDAAVATGRETADAGIASDVKTVNADLTALASNAADIKKATALGQSTASLEDTRDGLVSDISSKLPVKVLTGKDGDITLTTDGGTTLYDGTVHALSFTATSNIPDSLTNDGTSSGLSGVTVDGQPISISQNGTIAANLQLRDGTLPQFADQLNQLAGNVISAFQSADPTVTAANPTGLFTVNGAALTGSTATAGLAGRIALNAAVDPDQGGEVWRMQAGMHATAAAGNSDSSNVLGFLAAMNQAGSYTTASGLSASSSMADAASQVAGLQQSTYSTWSSRNTTRTTQANDAQTALSNATGVNVDEQMQRLLLIQQTYAASSQVIQAAAQMLSTMNSVASGALG